MRARINGGVIADNGWYVCEGRGECSCNGFGLSSVRVTDRRMRSVDDLGVGSEIDRANPLSLTWRGEWNVLR
jgi:hypothetical protein